jgi:hypothetical protein
MNTMSGYELRHHLADDHGVNLSGTHYAEMVDIHNDQHYPDASRPAPTHDHDDKAKED